MAKFSFRVLAGMHVDKGPDNCDCSRCAHDRVVDANNRSSNPKPGMYKKGHVYRQGDIVHTDKDLSRYNGNGPKFMKFERVDSTGRSLPNEAPPASDVNLEGMSLNSLREFAEQEEIDISNLTKKSDIIKAIEAATQPA